MKNTFPCKKPVTSKYLKYVGTLGNYAYVSDVSLGPLQDPCLLQLKSLLKGNSQSFF